MRVFLIIGLFLHYMWSAIEDHTLHHLFMHFWSILCNLVCPLKKLAVQIHRCLIACLVSQLKNDCNIQCRTSQHRNFTYSIRQFQNCRTTLFAHKKQSTWHGCGLKTDLFMHVNTILLILFYIKLYEFIYLQVLLLTFLGDAYFQFYLFEVI